MEDLETLCPICGQNFPPNVLEAHASECGESKAAFISSASQLQEMSISSLDDVLQAISAAVNKAEEFPLTVSRSNLVERGLTQWKHQKKASPTSLLKIRFIGEAGLDTGALRKEFLTEMISGIEQKLFEGDQIGKCPKYSMLDLDQANFRSAGEIWAASLAQSGPPPCCLKLWCYKYLCDGEIQIQHISKQDVSDAQYTSLISHVESASEDTLFELVEEILSCGYTGPIHVEKKEEIIRAVVLHAILRLLPLFCQLREGLALYGVADLMRQYPDVCQVLFVPGLEVKADADSVFAMCRPMFSDKGSIKEQMEVTLMNHLQDFLQSMEACDHLEAGPDCLSPSKVLQWLTGQGHIPVLPEERLNFQVCVEFIHNCDIQYGTHTVCYPTVAACSNTIRLPVKYMQTYAEFVAIMSEAFHLGQAFHQV
ncbi:uncharacterized protein LOC132870874 isoform X2 [Neoarius graeffei]|uniref:uncharacterized protein LOC132870874 isoform X2 n=1 Tax=Neoarius graeffei TaxID=443677 RepID=UPI00298CC7BE|nr:uncharacterized protein LOC132870874 isoform X2 [Neoarius graeffei]